jgi:WD40-like Beta Propeller Repeat
MNPTMPDDRLDAEIRLSLAELWDSAGTSAPSLDDMSRRLSHRTGVHRWHGVPNPAVIIALGMLLTAAIGFAIIGSSAPRPVVVVPGPTPSINSTTPSTMPHANGPIAVGSWFHLIDPGTGSSSDADRCPDCWLGDADWSPDGSTLAFVRTYAGSSDALWTWSPGADNAKRLWTCEIARCSIEHPSWSPDGHAIVLETMIGMFEDTDLVIVHPAGGSTTIPKGSLRAVGYPSWTPDGRILFTAYPEDGAAFATMEQDGTDMRIIREFPTGAPGPAALSPDGRSIAYLQVTHGPKSEPGIGPQGQRKLGLWLIDVSRTGDPPRLLWQRKNCCVGAGTGGPEWSPDGTMIAIIAIQPDPSSEPPGDTMSLVNVNVTTGEPLVLGHADPYMPAWRPVP